MVLTRDLSLTYTFSNGKEVCTCFCNRGSKWDGSFLEISRRLQRSTELFWVVSGPIVDSMFPARAFPCLS